MIFQEKKKELEVHVIDLRKRLQVLEDIDKTLVDLNLFNQELVIFDSVLTELDNWISGPAQERLDTLKFGQEAGRGVIVVPKFDWDAQMTWP